MVIGVANFEYLDHLKELTIYPAYKRAESSERVLFEDMYGSTDGEAKNVFEMLGLLERLKDYRLMYGGYRTGTGLNLYCPYSLMRALSHTTEPLQAYWAEAASAKLIVPHLIVSNYRCGRPTIERIVDLCTTLEGKIKISDSFNFKGKLMKSLPISDIDRGADSLWTYMYYAGYLTAIPTEGFDQDAKEIDVVYFMPNEEVREAWIKFFHGTLFGNRRREVDHVTFPKCLDGLQKGDLQVMCTFFQLAGRSFSFMNEPRKLREDPLEDWYHRVFSSVFSIILHGHYSVAACVESGMGKPDLLFLPTPNLPYFPIAMEFNVAHASEDEMYHEAVKKLETLAEAACVQIKNKAYHDSSTLASYAKLYQFAVAIQGKFTAVRYRTLNQSARGKWVDPIDTAFSNFDRPYDSQPETSFQVGQAGTSNAAYL